jgi:predicted dehydrogenase
MKRVRAAIVGLGVIAPSHMRALNEAADRVELAAIVDNNPQRLENFAETNGVSTSYADLDAMLAAERPDIVHLCTPPGIHLGQIEKCLEAGAQVFCEKPLCGSLAELDQIREMERRTGGFVATVFQWRFGSAGQHLKQLISQGVLGRAMVGVCNTLWYRDDNYYAKDAWRGTWQYEFGGSAITQGIHLTDLFLWLMGEWQDVSAVVGTLNHHIEIDDVSAAIVRFENGAVGSIMNSVVSPRQESYVRLDFEHATAEVTALYRYSNENWRFTPTAPEETAPADLASAWPPAEDVASFHVAQYRRILDALERHEAPPVSTLDVRTVTEFISSLYKSAATQQPVQRGSIAPGDAFYDRMAGTLAQAKAKV